MYDSNCIIFVLSMTSLLKQYYGKNKAIPVTAHEGP
jgi:hypothetical protein